jgi:hypothetical protein
MRAVKTLAVVFLLLAQLAWAAEPASGPPPIFSRSDPPPGAFDPGHLSPPWPDAADMQEATAESNLERWALQANAGRARAALITGRYWLEQVPRDPQNCAKAIEWLQKADKLGSNEAAGWLGHVYRRFDCPQRNLATAATWLRKAVPLMTFGAAGDLRDLYSQADAPEHDAQQAYVYARVAKPEAEVTGDTTSAQSTEAALGDKLGASQRKSATEEADKLLAAIDRRRAALTTAPREEKLKSQASGAGWNVGVVAFDDLRECAANTADNCKGVRRLAYFDAANRGDEYLRCKFSLDHREFGTGKLATLERETLLPPKSTRKLVAGRVGEVGGNADLRVACAPVAGLAADVTAGKCKANATGVPSAADFYPPASRARGEEGRVLLAVFIARKDGHADIVELMGSSGFPDLDAAGVRMGSYMAFHTDCERGYMPIAVSFRLAEGR